MIFTIFKRLLGVVCIIVGLFALVTPLTPGSWLALVGLELLGLTFLLPKWIRLPYEEAKKKAGDGMKSFFSKKKTSIPATPDA